MTSIILKMKTILMIAIGILVFASFISAENIEAGNNYTFKVNTATNLSWSVVNNQSNMIGLKVYQNYPNITIITDYRMKPDNFTIILSSNKKIIRKIIVYRGGGRKEIIIKNVTKYINRTIEVPKKIEIIKYINNTKEKNKPNNKKKSNNLTYVLVLIIMVEIGYLCYLYKTKKYIKTN